MKKLLMILIVINIILLAISHIHTGVQVRTQTITQYKFDVTAGQRILVIDKGAKTYIRITPSEARLFDLKVGEGKSLSGILIRK
jgi:hypothetical protein